ncbi:MAG: tRNA (adenosine(37)-N6)-threonylcarbamoyltransferase complex ATPase subunit type 1 TsaE [Opitutales bacterium]
MTASSDNILERLQAGVRTTNVAETEAVAAAFAPLLAPGSVLCLQGPLGAGKTAFVRGLAQGLGCTDLVSSPTFNLLQVYDGPRRLLHLDAYRIERPEGLNDLGLEELFNDAAVLAVEWPEKVATALPPDCWWLELQSVDERTRSIQTLRCP